MFDRMLEPFNYSEWRSVMKMPALPFRNPLYGERRRVWLEALGIYLWEMHG